jgi:hypothetical protein
MTSYIGGTITTAAKSGTTKSKPQNTTPPTPIVEEEIYYDDEETPTPTTIVTIPYDGSQQYTNPFAEPTMSPSPYMPTTNPMKIHMKKRPTTTPPISTTQPQKPQPTTAPNEPPIDMSTYEQNINAIISRYSPYASSSKEIGISSTAGPEKYPEIEQILEDRETTDARRAHLEDSVRKWNESMNRILLYVTAAIFACLIIIIIYNYLYLPTAIFVIAIVAVIATAAIFSARQYYDSINRWKMDYDVIDYSPPILHTTVLPPEGVPNSQIGSSIFSGWCMDSTCCSAGTIWDPAAGKCAVVVPTTPSK